MLMSFYLTMPGMLAHTLMVVVVIVSTFVGVVFGHVQLRSEPQ